MLRRTSLRFSLFVALTACAAPGADGGGGDEYSDGYVVPDGKADDFFSLTAAEYVIEGRATVELEAEYADRTAAERDARVKELIGLEQIAINWFLTQYLIDKESTDSNASFGGYGAIAKTSSWDDLDIQSEGGLVYSFRLALLVAGPKDLMDRMPLEELDDGSRGFVLTIGKPTNEEMAKLETNHEWYRSAPWDDWAPTNVDESRREDLTLSIRRERESEDAWFDYAALFDDGVLDIDVHMGWDYHSAYHVKHARALYSWLKDRGYRAPVSAFASLDRESGAFTKTLNANGREVEVRVRIFYGQDGTETDPDTDAGGRVLEEDMRESLRTVDVIIYSGHSGPFYGFALGNWKMTEEGDLDDSEMSTVEMPAERYQVIVAEGCDTYQIGEAFRRNPAKPDGAYVDVITTTAPSNATSPEAVQNVIARLTETDDRGRHRPRTVKSLLRDLDRSSSWFHTMYGIHGIDDNPQLHPYAAVENMCSECTRDSQCGGVGNRCVGVAGAGKRCAPSCTTDAACGGDGYACREIASTSSRVIYDTVCVPVSMSCE